MSVERDEKLIIAAQEALINTATVDLAPISETHIPILSYVSAVGSKAQWSILLPNILESTEPKLGDGLERDSALILPMIQRNQSRKLLIESSALNQSLSIKYWVTL